MLFAPLIIEPVLVVLALIWVYPPGVEQRVVGTVTTPNIVNAYYENTIPDV
jgi:hypothetical protein